MQDEEWIKNLEDGSKVKFTYLKLSEYGAFVTAQVAGNEVVYSVVLTNAKKLKIRLAMKMLKVISRASLQGRQPVGRCKFISSRLLSLRRQSLSSSDM
jgi:hypothetical protein